MKIVKRMKVSKHHKGGKAESILLSRQSSYFPPDVGTVSPTKRLQWLRSQIIGSHAECLTPFGTRHILYADHTASGRSFMFIEEYILHHVLPYYGNTHTDDSFVGQRTTHLAEEATTYVKRCLGGTDSDAILFCGNGSTAAIKRLQEIMGLTVPSPLRKQVLETIEEEARWVVFVGPYEHHSNLLSWRQSLAEVVEIPLGRDGTIDMDELRAALQNPKYDGRPKLGSFSACSNVTGIVTDTRAIAKLLHAHGAFACFDFAASGPYVEIDMRSGQPDGYDAVFLSPHKFLGGPGSSGVLLMNKRLYLLDTCPPSTCGGGTVDFVNHNEQNTIYYADIEKREDAGTPGIVQKIRTALTFFVKEVIGPELICSRESLLIDMALSRLAYNPNILIHGGTKAKRIAILSFNVMTTLRPDGGHHEASFTGFQHQSGNRSPRNVLTGSSSPLRIFKRGGKKKESMNTTITNNGPGDQQIQPFLTRKKDHEMSWRGKPLHGRFITKLLNDLFGIQGRGGCSCAAPYAHELLGIDDQLSLSIREGMMKGFGGLKPGWARVNFGFYITREEFEFLIAAIEFIAAYGQRLLRLYDFDWETGDWTFKNEYKPMLEEAEKQVAARKGKTHWWSLHMHHDQESAARNQTAAFTLINPPSSQALVGKLNPDQLTYIQIAECMVESLPDQPPLRDIPEGLDPHLVTFRV